MQPPTLQNVRIRSIRDAHHIFHAVATNVLPMTMRRLDAEERKAIASGNVYVWEERVANSEATGAGIERWTDGMRWSPSRVRDDFLFYHQKETGFDDDSPPTKWARMVKPRADSVEAPNESKTHQKLPHTRPSNDPEKLIKQTYSVTVNLPEDRPRGIKRKWHLTAYFTQATIDGLQTVNEQPGVGRVHVPEGLFKCARSGKTRRDSVKQRQQQANDGDRNSVSILSSHDQPRALPIYNAYPSATLSHLPPMSRNTTSLSNNWQAENSYSTGSSQPKRDIAQRPTPAPPLPPMVHSSYSPPALYTPTPASVSSVVSSGLPPYNLSLPYHYESSSGDGDSFSGLRSSSQYLTLSDPKTFISPHLPTSPEAHTPMKRNLVPLDHLQNSMGPRRDPGDDLLLRQLDALSTVNKSIRRNPAAGYA
ncbi:hypothetical protein BD410DRAFT_896814 [Rickenella mellea]|uniref:cAMP-independent regulatory protein pac2 n=1 Tax=Rickenella mellea TaxID=50990 RepID=A0A4Y7QAL5_9AGAM|nr:hypothetical protein BD410DRAFT_896814 [Rickenella mellea]